MKMAMVGFSAKRLVAHRERLPEQRRRLPCRPVSVPKEVELLQGASVIKPNAWTELPESLWNGSGRVTPSITMSSTRSSSPWRGGISSVDGR